MVCYVATWLLTTVVHVTSSYVEHLMKNVIHTFHIANYYSGYSGGLMEFVKQSENLSIQQTLYLQANRANTKYEISGNQIVAKY